MTPYAILKVRPQDGDDYIRTVYHSLAKDQHPDRPGASGTPGLDWYAITAAYKQINTQEKRDALVAQYKLLAGRCEACSGLGVMGGARVRLSLRVCDACNGEGGVGRPRRFAKHRKL